MCGIIGALAPRSVQDVLLTALQRMEYRGYDSAGICTLADGDLHCEKRSGKLTRLRQALDGHPLPGRIGIGHTRWATHGVPNEINAHPHRTDSVATVHNGIIENYAELKRELTAAGGRFVSDTDTEVVPVLFESLLGRSDDPLTAWRRTLERLHGAYALVTLTRGTPGQLWFARKGSPLLLARGRGTTLVASDALAVAGMAEEIAYLRDGEWGVAGGDACQAFAADGTPVALEWRPMPDIQADGDKGGFDHYMEKEIHEQPEVLAGILDAYVRGTAIHFPEAAQLHAAPLPERMVMVACGTSYHAALTARYWLERYLKIPVEVDVASEYRYRDPVIGKGTWLVTLSQSGETADTLEALRLFKAKTPDNLALGICNVPHSSLARESDAMIQLHAGPEIGVASTKAYTAQLMVLALFSLLLASRAGAMKSRDLEAHLDKLRSAVVGIRGFLSADSKARVETVAGLFHGAVGALFLGRGPCYPLALEGALKLKEISYLHAEGYAAGEMKHGPIALIDANLPVVVIAPRQYHLDKVLSNLKEVQARGARIILITDLPEPEWPANTSGLIPVPEGDYFSTPLLVAVPLQLIAYVVARNKGTDVDQPRNLAKSVTVE
jgi:glucosamine--fructose-6-phosphate aminotransferase (isomerizing)